MSRLAKVSLRVLVMQLVLVCVLALPAWAQSAQADNHGFVSGSVFVDANQNGMAEPVETSVPFATVHVQSQADPAVLYTVLTDAAGYYVVSGLPYGLYTVWGESANQTAAGAITVELSEVNSASSVDLPMYDNSADLELTSIKVLYLPFAVR